MSLIKYYQDGDVMSRRERRQMRRNPVAPQQSAPQVLTPQREIQPAMQSTSALGLRGPQPAQQALSNTSLLQKRTAAPQEPVYDTFDQQFGQARKAGLKLFNYKGKSFGTQLATEVQPTKQTTQAKPATTSGGFGGSGQGASFATPSTKSKVINYKNPQSAVTTPPQLNGQVNVNDPKHGMSLPVTEIKSTRLNKSSNTKANEPTYHMSLPETEIKSTRIYPQKTNQNLSPQELTKFLQWKNRMKLYPGHTTHYTQNDVNEWRNTTQSK